LLGAGTQVKISEDAKGCVVFFGFPTEDVPIKYGGTGFLVRITEGGLGFGYLVTCRHVAKALERVGGYFVRANTRGGASENLPVQSIDWRYHTDATVDLALANIHFDLKKFDHFYFDIEGNFLPVSEACCGDMISLIGLFRLHPGSSRNLAIVHSGNIAMLPDPNERIPLRDSLTGEIVQTESYLVEAQTLDGLSGSPAFVHETVALESFTRLSDGRYPGAFGAVKLLGLYSGSWDGEPGAILAADRNLRGGMRVPIGIGIVVPAERIIELIMGDDKLKKHRKKIIDKHDAERAATTDSAIPAPPADDANPKHREDFRALLNAAVKGPESED